VAKDYCRYKPVSIQAYGIKWDYSDNSIEPIGNIDSCAEDTNGTEAKALDAKKENETFKNKISNWWSNNDSKANSSQFENSINSPSKNNTPVESMIIIHSKYVQYFLNLIFFFHN